MKAPSGMMHRDGGFTIIGPSHGQGVRFNPMARPQPMRGNMAGAANVPGGRRMAGMISGSGGPVRAPFRGQGERFNPIARPSPRRGSMAGAASVPGNVGAAGMRPGSDGLAIRGRFNPMARPQPICGSLTGAANVPGNLEAVGMRGIGGTVVDRGIRGVGIVRGTSGKMQGNKSMAASACRVCASGEEHIVYVHGIVPNSKDVEIYKLFSTYGRIVRVFVGTIGSAIVHMGSYTEAVQAITALHGFWYEKSQKTLRVSFKEE